jgi:hypothetical protein
MKGILDWQQEQQEQRFSVVEFEREIPRALPCAFEVHWQGPLVHWNIRNSISS